MCDNVIVVKTSHMFGAQVESDISKNYSILERIKLDINIIIHIFYHYEEVKTILITNKNNKLN